jgi:hypothetical protein
MTKKIARPPRSTQSFETDAALTDAARQRAHSSSIAARDARAINKRNGVARAWRANSSLHSSRYVSLAASHQNALG